MILPLIAAAALTLPVIDHQRAQAVRPISSSVILCASASALPLARLAARSLDSAGPDYGFDRLAQSGGCLSAMNTDPMAADFQEDVVWAGALQPPSMLHGTLREVRVRLDTPLPGYPGLQGYFYVAAEDLRP